MTIPFFLSAMAKSGFFSRFSRYILSDMSWPNAGLEDLDEERWAGFFFTGFAGGFTDPMVFSMAS